MDGRGRLGPGLLQSGWGRMRLEPPAQHARTLRMRKARWLRTRPARWPARPHWSPAAPAASAGPPPPAWPRSAPASGITGRDKARTQAAAAQIAHQAGNPAVGAFAADMSSQAEVRRLAAAVLDAYPRLDALINNVGGFWATRHVTADGLERTFAVNHLAAF